MAQFDEDELISEMGDLDPSKAQFLLLSDHEIKSMIEEEQSKMERGDPKNIHEALYSKHVEHKKRRQELMNMKDDGLDACTFQPNISTSRSSKASKRSYGRFYADMIDFQRKKKEKMHEMKKKCEEDQLIECRKGINARSQSRQLDASIEEIVEKLHNRPKRKPKELTLDDSANIRTMERSASARRYNPSTPDEVIERLYYKAKYKNKLAKQERAKSQASTPRLVTN